MPSADKNCSTSKLRIQLAIGFHFADVTSPWPTQLHPGQHNSALADAALALTLTTQFQFGRCNFNFPTATSLSEIPFQFRARLNPHSPQSPSTAVPFFVSAVLAHCHRCPGFGNAWDIEKAPRDQRKLLVVSMFVLRCHHWPFLQYNYMPQATGTTWCWVTPIRSSAFISMDL
jgi:hypothetical protein